MYVSRGTNAIVAVLQVIAPNDADNLWETVLSSLLVWIAVLSKVLGTSLPGERKYLKALAETYENARSWDTKQQC